ncbi:FG-GAP-like repeat-containing protein [Pontimicrobium sp. IMCC45349]|uniref:FG-GAP-like repeat-containing protein n=1 Tax=Pontimicrobium sp. IMCC45349 TaxID=3391574 RepID=UPI0039A380FC
MNKFLLFIALCTLPFLGSSQAGDNCANAIDIGAGLHTAGTINGDVPPTNCYGGGAASDGEWYMYTPTSDNYTTITSDLAQNSGGDTRIHVYTGVCGALICLTSDDDAGDIGNGYLSIVNFEATANETYYIVWDDYWNDNGFDFELSEGTPPPSAPATFTSQSVSASGSDRGVVDMNNDGLDDLVSVTTTNININYQLAGGGFNSVNIGTTSADNDASWSMAAGDFDKNGYNDLLYGGGSGVTFMQANSDGTAFTEISGSEYVFSQRSNFIDINNDGNLDAFVCHDVAPNVYYINDNNTLDFYQGSGASQPVPSGIGTHPNGGNYGTVWIDYDNDGDMDMFIAKCRGGNVTHKINELWRNDKNPSDPNANTFTNVAGDAGVNLADPVQTWSSAWADFDNDGDMDAYIGASSTADGGHKFMRNNGDGTFTDVTAGAGLDSAPYGIENAPGDFDNDGYVDILTNGRLLMNNGNMTFTLYSSNTPPSGPIGDVNDDGFLDVFNGLVYTNDGNSNNWLKIRTIGVASNYNGIGARVTIVTPSGTQIRDVRSGEGFRYMSSLNTHFGLGADTTITSVIIDWPSGTTDVVLNPNINETLTVIEGETLSLTESLTQDLILYPNPTKGDLNINATYGFEDAVYTIFDINGKSVLSGNFDSNTIDASSLSTGNYILKIVSNGLTKTQKFIKQ